MSRRISFDSSGIFIGDVGDDVKFPTKPLLFNSNLACCPLVSRSYVNLVNSTQSVYINFNRTFSGIPLVSLIFSPTGLPSTQPLGSRRLLYLVQGSIIDTTINVRLGTQSGAMQLRIRTRNNRIELYQNAINDAGGLSFMPGVVIGLVYDYRETVS